MSNRKGSVIRSKNGYMESVDIREDGSRKKKNKRMWFNWVESKEVCNCWFEWGELVSEVREMGGVCMCGELKKLCISDECECEVVKWSSCKWVEVWDLYEIESGKYIEGREDLIGLRECRL